LAVSGADHVPPTNGLQPVLDAVRQRRPVDARERRAIDEFCTKVSALARPFDEHADRTHITASAIVVSDDGGRVVLHRHKRLGLWLQPGGHIEHGETPQQAALREAAEETGLPVRLDGDDLVHVDVHPGPRRHTHLDLRYLVRSPQVAPAPSSSESQDVRWFHWHEAVAMADPGLAGVLRALQPGQPKIRPARHSDATDCAEVYCRSRRFVTGVSLDDDQADVRRWMSDDVIGRTDAWVADLDGTIVGVMVLDRAAVGGWIEHLYLDPAWIGRGLGQRFVGLARERFPDGLQLWTFAANSGARRFVERLGFVAVEYGDGSGNAVRQADVRYEWALRSATASTTETV
jgi:8-oxo-dGTP pyrophosphatase MutT (NUDIX family)/GNAT superfamily N-acetyltransferase